jgi:hypothetical protein
VAHMSHVYMIHVYANDVSGACVSCPHESCRSMYAMVYMTTLGVRLYM